MKAAFASLGFALGASASSIASRSTCCFSLTASGGVSGVVGQLTDGQNRIAQTAGLAITQAEYCLTNGAITDEMGRGCILTPPTTQFQCDTGATPESGFSVVNGELEYNGSETFWACPTGDFNGYNIYTTPVAGQLKCVTITLSTGGQCSAASSSSSSKAVSSSASSSKASSIVSSSKAANSTVTSSKSSSKASSSSAASSYSTSKPVSVSSSKAVSSSAATSSSKAVSSSAAPSSSTKAATSSSSTPVAPVVVSSTSSKAATSSSSTYVAPVVNCVTSTATVTVTSVSYVTVTACTATVESCAATSSPASSTKAATSSTPVAPVVASSSKATSSAPAAVSSSKAASSTPAAVSSSKAATSSPAVSSSKAATSSPAVSSSKAASSMVSSSKFSNSTVTSTKLATSTVTTKTSSSTSSSGTVCPTTLNSGSYQYPHAIIPVNENAPTTSYGTQYFAYLGGGNSTIFTFDYPTTYSGLTCSLVFLLPLKSELETSSFTISGSGGLTFTKLASTVPLTVDYDTVPASAGTLGSISSVTPGNSYVVDTFACPSGSSESIEVSVTGTLDLVYFEDYNPSPIGLYVTTC